MVDDDDDPALQAAVQSSLQDRIFQEKDEIKGNILFIFGTGIYEFVETINP